MMTVVGAGLDSDHISTKPARARCRISRSSVMRTMSAPPPLPITRSQAEADRQTSSTTPGRPVDLLGPRLRLLRGPGLIRLDLRQVDGHLVALRPHCQIRL